jgi:hypothetical protein
MFVFEKWSITLHENEEFVFVCIRSLVQNEKIVEANGTGDLGLSSFVDGLLGLSGSSKVHFWGKEMKM